MFSKRLIKLLHLIIACTFHHLCSPLSECTPAGIHYLRAAMNEVIFPLEIQVVKEFSLFKKEHPFGNMISCINIPYFKKFMEDYLFMAQQSQRP